VRDSTKQLAQMVPCICHCLKDLRDEAALFFYLERCICGNIWDPRGDIPADEQYGRTAGMPVVMVHRLLNRRLLVLPCRVVVSTMNVIPCIISFSPIVEEDQPPSHKVY
jgi:hypothetical protein